MTTATTTAARPAELAHPHGAPAHRRDRGATTAIVARSVRSRLLSAVIASVSLGTLLLLAMAVYAQIDTAIYDALPEAVRATMGIPAGADAATLAFSVMLGSMGALTLGGVALSIGAGTLAGEEGSGTLSLLLSNPVSRTRVVLSKAVALLMLVIAMTALLWGMAAATPVVLGVDAGESHIGAMSLALGANTAFYGFLALAVGAWTGRRGLASAVTALVMAVSFVTVGLLPLFSATEDLVRLVPWHWFDGSKPLVNGVDWSDIALLSASIVVFATVAVIGFGRRDLVGQSTGTTLRERLLAHPATQKLARRVGGQARVSSLSAKTASDHQGLLSVVAGLMFAYMGLLIGPVYAAMADTVKDLDTALPAEMMAMVGGGGMSTPEGFYQTETLGLMGPIAVILVGATVAVKGIAGQEQEGRMGLLLANPVSRGRVLGSVLVVALGYVVVTATATGLGIAGGSLIAGLGMSMTNIAGAATLLTLLGAVYAAIALAISAGTGRPALAIWGTVGLALVGHFGNAVLSLSDGLSGWTRLSPFHYYSSSLPLVNGINWAHAGGLAAVTALIIGVSFWLYQRRDLRQR